VRAAEVAATNVFATLHKTNLKSESTDRDAKLRIIEFARTDVEWRTRNSDIVWKERSSSWIPGAGWVALFPHCLLRWTGPSGPQKLDGLAIHSLSLSSMDIPILDSDADTLGSSI
jgi:hypothetical protein